MAQGVHFPAKNLSERKLSTMMRGNRKPEHKKGSRRRISCKDLGFGECEGWLWHRKEKSGFAPKSWRKYWFMLKDKSLYCYKDPQDVVARRLFHMPAFVVSLANEASKKFAFKISNASFGTVLFATKDYTDMSKWMTQLHLSCLAENNPTENKTMKSETHLEDVSESENEEEATEDEDRVTLETTIEKDVDSEEKSIDCADSVVVLAVGPSFETDSSSRICHETDPGDALSLKQAAVVPTATLEPEFSAVTVAMSTCFNVPSEIVLSTKTTHVPSASAKPTTTVLSNSRIQPAPGSSPSLPGRKAFPPVVPAKRNSSSRSSTSSIISSEPSATSTTSAQQVPTEPFVARVFFPPSASLATTGVPATLPKPSQSVPTSPRLSVPMVSTKQTPKIQSIAKKFLESPATISKNPGPLPLKKPTAPVNSSERGSVSSTRDSLSPTTKESIPSPEIIEIPPPACETKRGPATFAKPSLVSGPVLSPSDADSDVTKTELGLQTSSTPDSSSISGHDNEANDDGLAEQCSSASLCQGTLFSVNQKDETPGYSISAEKVAESLSDLSLATRTQKRMTSYAKSAKETFKDSNHNLCSRLVSLQRALKDKTQELGILDKLLDASPITSNKLQQFCKEHEDIAYRLDGKEDICTESF